MQLFYYKNISSDIITLPTEESKHIIRVLRKSVGDEIQLTNGEGSLFTCQIVDANTNKCKVEIINEEKSLPPYYLKYHIAIAPPKSQNRLDWMIEKICELGIGTISPLICTHSERKHTSIDRIERVAIAAIKQSLKTFMPQINEAVRFSTFIKSNQAEEKLIAHLNPQAQYIKKQEQVSNSIIIIGPEGDFSEEEIELAINNNYQILKLGDQRLRTETAALVGLNQLHTRHLLAL